MFRARVEKEMVFEAKHIRVGQNASLRVEKESVNSVAGLHLLHVIRSHSVKKAGAIFAGDANPAALRQVEQRRARQSAIRSPAVEFSSHRVGPSYRNGADHIMNGDDS